MPFQANIFTGEVENVKHKKRDQTEEQMELDALTSISASLPKKVATISTRIPFQKETHDRAQKVKRLNENNQSLLL